MGIKVRFRIHFGGSPVAELQKNAAVCFFAKRNSHINDQGCLGALLRRILGRQKNCFAENVLHQVRLQPEELLGVQRVSAKHVNLDLFTLCVCLAGLLSYFRERVVQTRLAAVAGGIVYPVLL